MEDLVEVVVSRLKIEAQLSCLGLVQFITSLHGGESAMHCFKAEAFKSFRSTGGPMLLILDVTCIVERVSSQETSLALPCQSTGSKLSRLRASARS